jgi:hypothetical protein
MGSLEVTESGRYDVAVAGGTPGGIAAAVRAGRAGLDVGLFAIREHLGGMMASGLSATDTTLVDRSGETKRPEHRSPVVDEFFERVRTHYRVTYGPDSDQLANCDGGLQFEPRVAEQVFDDLVADADVEVHHGVAPAHATREGRSLQKARFDGIDDDRELIVEADTFVEGTYEGDLAAAADVPFRVGREPRGAYDEQYAGRLFSEKGSKTLPGSTGVGDDAVQAYDYRVTLSTDPENRRRPDRPDEYDRTEYLPILEAGDEDTPGPARSEAEPCHLKSELVRPTLDEIRERGLQSLLLIRGPLPNDKWDMNTADLPGESRDYPEATWERRREIERRHRDHALGLLYFLQNDDVVPDDLQEEALQWGLPRDEFPESDGFPFQLYVREARRIEGRTTFTEHDARHAEGIDRAPINGDAVAIAEYPMDAHDCRPVRRPGSLAEGHFFLSEVTVPSQVPYRAMLPEDLDDLVVPVPLSATHVGFGTIRLEPTWMQIGEAAGAACALAADRDTTPGALDAGSLQRTLADDGSWLTFFNDVEPGVDDPAVAAGFLGAKGFFRGFDARPTEPLGPKTAAVWADGIAGLLDGSIDPSALARRLPKSPDGEVMPAEFRTTVAEALADHGLDTDTADGLVAGAEGSLDRGTAIIALYELLP